ncbi:hypothetical protein MUK42_23826 [Musa troglodytarum]|uniref:Oxidative stress 3 n=1 Tax=Musa troglodytarum TaxID=320322 RepID=A0A9E7KDP4_9LILI|nr:hypothetical protein MUK42_23826 [Musa troglodytarum]
MGEGDLCEASSSHGESGDSELSWSSALTDDATSSSPRSSSTASQPDSNGSLFDLSSLMAQLPIKRGLSQYYQGKSQSFRSLSDVRCIEDLAKEENPNRKKMKVCHGIGGLGATPRLYKKTTSRRASRGSCPSLPARRNGSSPLRSGAKPLDLPPAKAHRASDVSCRWEESKEEKAL